MDDVFVLCDLVRQTAFEVHRYFRHGYAEKIYENALAARLRRKDVVVKQQQAIRVYDEDGSTVGDYYADMVVASCLIVEIKAVRALVSEHEAQLLGYLRGTRLVHGLLINFGAARLQVRKLVHSH